MKVAVFSTRPYEIEFLERANADLGHDLTLLEPRLTLATAPLAGGFEAISVFVNDDLSRPVLERLIAGGVRLIALRCAGFNNVDVLAAEQLGLAVVRVPAYSPHSVAEHTVGLILALNRKLHKAYSRVREGNLSLNGLMGFDLNGRAVGVVGTGKIGAVVIRIMTGFGCNMLAYDPYPNPEVRTLGAEYVPLDTLYRESDVISLHCPLSPQTRHMIGDEAVARMKPGVLLVNTSRGGLVDTRAVIAGLKSERIGALGIDVYEEEADLFFEDLSNQVIRDDVFARLLTFPNVIVTGHQAFFTRDSMEEIMETTMKNIDDFAHDRPLHNRVTGDLVRPK